MKCICSQWHRTTWTARGQDNTYISSIWQTSLCYNLVCFLFCFIYCQHKCWARFRKRSGSFFFSWYANGWFNSDAAACFWWACYPQILHHILQMSPREYFPALVHSISLLNGLLLIESQLSITQSVLIPRYLIIGNGGPSGILKVPTPLPNLL